MFSAIIKYYFIYYFCYFICNKITHLMLNKFTVLVSFVMPFPLAYMTYFLGCHCIELKYIFPLFILWISISIYFKKPQIAFVACCIAYGVSYSLYALASFVVFLSAYIFTSDRPLTVLALLSGLLQLCFIFLLFKIKRFKSNILCTLKTSIINFATIICLVLILFLTFARLHNLYISSFFVFFIALAFLIFWWQAQITKSYRRSLELRELESLRTELAEKNADMVKFMKEYERIRLINHRDNNLLCAMEHTLNSYLITDFSDREDAVAKREELLLELHKVRGSRESAYKQEPVAASPAVDTGLSLLNTLIHHMNKEASLKHIMFTVHQSTDLEPFVPRDISDEDLVHLVDDLLKNAFKATEDCEVRLVQLQFYKWNKHLVVEVADSGTPFEVKSIVNMGIAEYTTHADTGGTGIGLMDIWNTKEKCGATYHMDEYQNPAPFSKKISLTFDRKNRFSVRSYRKDEILQMAKRADLQVYGETE